MELPEVWHSVGGDAGAMERELEREIVEGHPLWGKSVRAVARRLDSDDVLFEVEYAEFRYAEVHLTWRTAAETDPAFPESQVFRSYEEWMQENGSD